jgi:hypothetical protein
MQQANIHANLDNHMTWGILRPKSRRAAIPCRGFVVITMCDKFRVLCRDTGCVVDPRGWDADA